jgi:acyl-coenzyme A thioesterase PaaI-like protein
LVYDLAAVTKEDLEADCRLVRIGKTAITWNVGIAFGLDDDISIYT